MIQADISDLISSYYDKKYLDVKQFIIADNIKHMVPLLNEDIMLETPDGEISEVIDRTSTYNEFDINSLILIPDAVSLDLIDFDMTTGMRKTDIIDTLDEQVIAYRDALENTITIGPDGWDGSSRFTVYIVDLFSAHTTCHYLFGDFTIPKYVKAIKLLDPYVLKDTSSVFVTDPSNILYDESDTLKENPLELYLKDIGSMYDIPMEMSPYERSKLYIKESQVQNIFRDYNPELISNFVFTDVTDVSQPTYTYSMTLYSSQLDNNVGMINITTDDSEKLSTIDVTIMGYAKLLKLNAPETLLNNVIIDTSKVVHYGIKLPTEEGKESIFTSRKQQLNNLRKTAKSNKAHVVLNNAQLLTYNDVDSEGLHYVLGGVAYFRAYKSRIGMEYSRADNNSLFLYVGEYIFTEQCEFVSYYDSSTIESCGEYIISGDNQSIATQMENYAQSGVLKDVPTQFRGIPLTTSVPDLGGYVELLKLFKVAAKYSPNKNMGNTINGSIVCDSLKISNLFKSFVTLYPRRNNIPIDTIEIENLLYSSVMISASNIRVNRCMGSGIIPTMRIHSIVIRDSLVTTIFSNGLTDNDIPVEKTISLLRSKFTTVSGTMFGSTSRITLTTIGSDNILLDGITNNQLPIIANITNGSTVGFNKIISSNFELNFKQVVGDTIVFRQCNIGQIITNVKRVITTNNEVNTLNLNLDRTKLSSKESVLNNFDKISIKVNDRSRITTGTRILPSKFNINIKNDADVESRVTINNTVQYCDVIITNKGVGGISEIIYDGYDKYINDTHIKKYKKSPTLDNQIIKSLLDYRSTLILDIPRRMKKLKISNVTLLTPRVVLATNIILNKTHIDSTVVISTSNIKGDGNIISTTGMLTIVNNESSFLNKAGVSMSLDEIDKVIDIPFINPTNVNVDLNNTLFDLISLEQGEVLKHPLILFHGLTYGVLMNTMLTSTPSKNMTFVKSVHPLNASPFMLSNNPLVDGMRVTINSIKGYHKLPDRLFIALRDSGYLSADGIDSMTDEVIQSFVVDNAKTANFLIHSPMTSESKYKRIGKKLRMLKNK